MIWGFHSQQNSHIKITYIHTYYTYMYIHTYSIQLFSNKPRPIFCVLHFLYQHHHTVKLNIKLYTNYDISYYKFCIC